MKPPRAAASKRTTRREGPEDKAAEAGGRTRDLWSLLPRVTRALVPSGETSRAALMSYRGGVASDGSGWLLP